jgi:hypothetical protein
MTRNFDNSKDASSAAIAWGTPASLPAPPAEELPRQPDPRRRRTSWDPYRNTGIWYHDMIESTVDEEANKSPADAPEQLAAERDIPEHYANSPLCPMHPLHPSHGKGWCPQHSAVGK